MVGHRLGKFNRIFGYELKALWMSGFNLRLYEVRHKFSKISQAIAC
ncbi:hypothetical protein [Globicatella sanguinis]